MILILGLALLAGAAWLYRDWAFVRRWMPAESATALAQPPSGMRKCRSTSSVTYTDGKCPAGSKEEMISGGSVTVIATPPDARSPATNNPASAGQNVRDLLLKPDAVNLQDKRMDEVIGK